MPEPDLVEIFAAPLHRSGARYLVAGSVGAMIYSEPRLTIDKEVLGGELRRRGLLDHFRTMCGDPDFV